MGTDDGRPNTNIGGSTMCNVKKYNKEVFKVGNIVNVVCSMCNGRGGFDVTRAIDQFRDDVDYEICPMCGGKGHF